MTHAVQPEGLAELCLSNSPEVNIEVGTHRPTAPRKGKYMGKVCFGS